MDYHGQQTTEEVKYTMVQLNIKEKQYWQYWLLMLPRIHPKSIRGTGLLGANPKCSQLRTLQKLSFKITLYGLGEWLGSLAWGVKKEDLDVTKQCLREIQNNLSNCCHICVLQTKYWVPEANSAIRRLLSKSDTYMELQDNRWLTYHYRQSCQIPVIYSTSAEVEHFGPFQVKHGPDTVKWYKVLFRCLAVAAVHLERAFSVAALYKWSSLLHSQKRPGKGFAMPTEDACCFLRPSVPTISDPWHVQLGCLCKKEMQYVWDISWKLWTRLNLL